MAIGDPFWPRRVDRSVTDGVRGAASAGDELLMRIVDALERRSDLHLSGTRGLLLEQIERRSGRRLYLPEAPIGRDWCFLLVQACADGLPGGVGVLVDAVDDLRPGSSLAHQLRRLGAAWETGVDVGTRGDPDGEAHPTDGERRDLTPVEIRELARAAGHGAPARHLLADAGFPLERVPVPDHDAVTFWWEVARLLRHGLLADGRRCVLAVAAARFPDNAVFAAYRT